MVRVSEQWPPFDQVHRSCAVAASFARVLTQVPAPLVALDGNATFLWHGQPVVVWPFIDGYRVERDDPTQRRLAAQLLAKLHRAALHIDHPGADSSDETYATRPTGSNPSGVPADPELDDWIGRWRDHRRIEEPLGWMHGDFFPGNILCSSGNEVGGLVDWDDAQHGPLITELASATWEFACTADRDTLAIDDARDFLIGYAQAGGPVQPCQNIVPLIRVRLRSSIAFFRRLQALGRQVDFDNERASIAAFTALRHLTLTV
jgi:Ser/Thr protein kinase RdoA (MazF antagonist)